MWEITTARAVSAFAGVTGICGYNGDNISAATAQLNIPYGVAFDGTGQLYIVDYYNCLIRKVNTSGIITTLAGTIANNASEAGATWSRSQCSTALSRAISTRNLSRMTSLSVAYSPEATFASIVSAISAGSVMLNCWVVRARGKWLRETEPITRVKTKIVTEMSYSWVVSTAMSTDRLCDQSQVSCRHNSLVPLFLSSPVTHANGYLFPGQ